MRPTKVISPARGGLMSGRWQRRHDQSLTSNGHCPNSTKVSWREAAEVILVGGHFCKCIGGARWISASYAS